MADKFYLGIDYGIKKTGIAIAQKVTKKSRPLKIIFTSLGLNSLPLKP